MLNKCETCNKNRRESNAVTKFREALSFSAFLVIFFAFAKSDMIATAIVILKPCGFSGILFAFQTREANTTRCEPNSSPLARETLRSKNFAFGEIYSHTGE